MKFTADGKIEGGQGNPEFVPPAIQDLMIDFTKSYYEHFLPISQWYRLRNKAISDY